MNTTLQIKTNKPKISFYHILLLILGTIAIFILTNWFSIKQATENTPNFNSDDLTELAEEIYNSGSITDAVNDLELDAAALAKMITEIERILKKTADYSGCELYYLHARTSGNYPVLGYSNKLLGRVYLNSGEVWKVGQTCNGEDGRYNNGKYLDFKNPNIKLTKTQLRYNRIYEGTYKQVLIMEKLTIYTYSLWSGYSDLLKPPGCKIYR